jgi:2-dehydropantoate 2-reductase
VKKTLLHRTVRLATASGKDKGEIYGDANWREKLSSALAEACTVAKAIGAEVSLADIQVVVDKLPASMRSSMQKDLAAGKPLELDAFGGPIVRGGKNYSIDVSTAAALIAAIREKEAMAARIP